LITVRVYSQGRSFAYAAKDHFCNALKQAGFRIDDQMQYEFCVHDTCDRLDSDWLIPGTAPPLETHLRARL